MTAMKNALLEKHGCKQWSFSWCEYNGLRRRIQRVMNKETRCEHVSFTREPLNWVHSPPQTANVLVFDVRTYKSD